MVLAIRKPDGELVVPPQADTKLARDDLLILVGPVPELASLAEDAT
jgi:K+/H+ antiporter YhaU regulatory subunit KhtT